MPRQARLDAPGMLHHVIIRGIERKKMVSDDQDRQNFVARLGTDWDFDLCLGLNEQPCSAFFCMAAQSDFQGICADFYPGMLFRIIVVIADGHLFQNWLLQRTGQIYSLESIAGCDTYNWPHLME